MYKPEQKLICIAGWSEGVWEDQDTFECGPGPKYREIVTLKDINPIDNSLGFEEYIGPPDDPWYYNRKWFVPVLDISVKDSLPETVENTIDIPTLVPQLESV